MWGLWNQNVGLPQIIRPGYVLCWAGKYHGSDDILFAKRHRSNNRAMLEKIHAELDNADAVVHYNGSNFDIPTLNAEFLAYGIKPPSPYKQIDLFKTVKNVFRFPSNKLSFVTKELGLGEKVRHEGHELWINCMKNDPEAWKVMEEYNKQDVILLERLYGHLLPWIKGHLNHSVFTDSLVCPVCGSGNLVSRGTTLTSAGRYPRYQCKVCSHWSRGNKSEAATEKRLSII